jgi:MoxR-like ATPase
VSTLSRALSLVSGRIQFTPDLMPADVTGTQVLGAERGALERRFTFRKGPIFVNVLLADEINRTPPKTQAACLEAMAEGQVTVGGAKHSLPRPFFVLATQNPIDDEGTYNLPEAQLDRFLLKVLVDYPSAQEEKRIVRMTTGVEEATVTSVLDKDDILALQWVVRCLRPSSHVVEYAARLARRSRPQEPDAPPWVRKLVAWGAGPRAGQALLMAAKARTLLHGQFAVTRTAVRDIAIPVLRHRIIPSFQAEAEGLTADDLVCRLLLETPPFEPKAARDATARRILRL